MNTPIQFKIRTIVTNSNADESQKNILDTYINTLTDENSAKLITIFDKYPQSIMVYADYIKELGEQSKPISPEKLEEILSSQISKLS
jgi:hypothetical protein